MDPWKSIRHLNKDEVRNLQNKKLHTFINQYLYPFSPHYRQLFDEHKINPKHIRTVDDLKNIPLTSKLNFIDENNPDKFKDFIQQPDEFKMKKFWPKQKLASLAINSLTKG